MKRLAVISPYAPPQRGAAVTRVTSLRSYLCRNSWSVDIWSPSWLRLEGGEPDRGVSFFRTYPGLFLGLLKTRPDAVMVTTPPGDLAFWGALTARVLLTPVLYDIRDPWTAAQKILGTIDPSSKRYLRQRRMERLPLLMADTCVSVTPFLRDMICHDYGVFPERFLIAPNGIDPEDFRRDLPAGQEVRRRLGIPGDTLVIVYEGIAGGKELDLFLRHCGKAAAGSGAHILFILIEDEWSRAIIEDLRAISRDLGIEDHVHIVGDAGHTDLSRYLSAGDVALNPLPSDLDYCLPVKTFEYMGCGLPVMSKASAEGPLSQVHRDHGIGPFASDWTGFTKTLEQILDGSLSLKGIGERNRLTVERCFTRSLSNETMLGALERMTG